MDLGYHVSDVPPSDGPLQIRTWSSGTFLQWKQQCHNDHQGQLVPMEHPVHRRGCANDQPRRYHQVPVEFHLPGRTRLHLFCDKVNRRQPQEQCANCNRLNSSWRFPQQNAILREGERNWVKPWHCEEATGWGRWLLQVHFWFEELAVITSLKKGSKNDLSFTLVVFVPLNDLIFLMKRARKARRCDSITSETINHWLTHTDWQR